MSLIQDIHNDMEKGALRLITEYRSRLMSDAVRLCANISDAEDLVSQTLVKVIGNLDSYKEDNNFYGWMKTIMVNIHRNNLARPVDRGTVPVEEESLVRYAGADTRTDEQIPANSDRDVLIGAINQLDPEYRRLVALYYFNDLSLREIAAFLNSSTSSVSRKLEVARKILFAKLEKKLGKRPFAVLAALLSLAFLATAAVATGWFADGNDRGTGVPPVQTETVSPTRQDATVQPNTTVTKKENTMNIKKIAAAALAATTTVAVVPAAQARTLTWQGASGGTWSVAANWQEEGGATAATAPTDGDVLRFANATAMKTVNDIDDLTVGELELTGTAALTINGSKFKVASKITKSGTTAAITDTVTPDIELLGDVNLNVSGKKQYTLKFNGVLSGSGGLVISLGDQNKLYLLGLNTFTGSVKYTGATKTTSFTYIKTLAPAGQPSSFGAGTDEIVFIGNLCSDGGTGTGGTTDRAWSITTSGSWNLSGFVFAGDCDFNNSSFAYGSANTLRFKGRVLNLAQVTLPYNSKGTLYFDSPENTIETFSIAYGKVYLNGNGSFLSGSGKTLTIGRNNNSSTTALYYTGTGHAVCGHTIDVDAMSTESSNSISVTNKTATLELSGLIKSTKQYASPLTFTGAGTLITSGTMQDTYSISKTGAGTWKHTGTATYSGTTTISAGRFELMGSMTSPITVKNGAVIAGTGTANDLTLQKGATFDVADFNQPLVLSGELTTTGDVTVQMPDDWDGKDATVITLGAASLTGKILVKGGVPAEAHAVVENGKVVVKEGPAPQACVWTGAVNGNWDTVTANWADSQRFVAGSEVVFPAGAANREVTLPADVVSGPMTITGGDDYSFSGGAILGNALFTLAGGGTVTFANQTQFSGVNVNTGAVTLAAGGCIRNSAVEVAKGASLTVAEGGSIDGDGSVTVRGTYENRSTTSSYTGNTALYVSTTVFTDRTFGAPDAGYVMAEASGLTIRFQPGVFLQKWLRKQDESYLTLVAPESGRAGLYGDLSHWGSSSGGYTFKDSSSANGGILEIGTPNGTNRFYNAKSGQETYGNSWTSAFTSPNGTNGVEINSRINYGHSSAKIMNDGRLNYAQVNSTNNNWDSTIISKGLLRVGANEALPSGATTYVVADSASEWACLDLRGHVQTLANLKDYEKDASAMKGEFVIRSTGGRGTLVVGGTSCDMIRPRTQFTGDLDIIKRGAGTAVFGFGAEAASDQSGYVSVEAGTLRTTVPGVFGCATNVLVAAGATLAVETDDTLGVPRTCRLDLADGATLSVPAGVTVKVAYAQVGNSGSDGKRLERGTYTKANLPNLISGDGKFVVKYDAGGLVIMVK